MTPVGGRLQLTQRSELTFRQNRLRGRHGWLRLTPAYSVGLVEQILDDHGAAAEVVFDPFSGSGTTALCAAYRGKTGLATDINPFLIWFANAKARAYEPRALTAFDEAAQAAARSATDADGPLAEVPPLSNIDRWWSPQTLSFLRRLKLAIEQHADSTLLQVAFCRTLIKLSNAAFNHQSMSFRPAPCPMSGDVSQTFGSESAHTERAEALDKAQAFLAEARLIAAAASDNPTGTAQYVLSDAREGLAKWQGRVDLLITSPPYPNRMSYIRELRPYMYWLGYLSTGREAGELDWSAIGGTWGIATSRLADWSARNEFAPAGLAAVLENIRNAHSGNGRLLANYVHRYFEDMFAHLQSTLPLLKREATVHYIIGNSIFYGHRVPAEDFLAQQMAAVGLSDISVTALRRRNSKQGLVEFRVSAVRRS